MLSNAPNTRRCLRMAASLLAWRGNQCRLFLWLGSVRVSMAQLQFSRALLLTAGRRAAVCGRCCRVKPTRPAPSEYREGDVVSFIWVT